MKFGINLGGGHLPAQSSREALEGPLEKARLAHQHGYHSLWSGSG
jgi:alkanesulfonate monooxygenase SsuD/methylene tetrahydromethanopterin reductase-like flavin-dependent oxidoreductase (luciferase family)